eukprot:1739755-Rhodomonas_salina.2
MNPGQNLAELARRAPLRVVAGTWRQSSLTVRLSFLVELRVHTLCAERPRMALPETRFCHDFGQNRVPGSGNCRVPRVPGTPAAFFPASGLSFSSFSAPALAGRNSSGLSVEFLKAGQELNRGSAV